MGFFDSVLGVPLGYILYGCYRLVGSYGWAVIIFALAIKIVLLPLSVMAQRNAITMVRIRPQLDDLKRRFEGNQTLLLEEQRALNKREGYSGFKAMLPLFIQVPIILGVIQVVYHPLRHLCHLDAATIGRLVDHAADLLGTTPGAMGSGAQVRALAEVGANPSAFTGVASPDVINTIASINLYFLGLDLGAVPSWTSVSIIWPWLAGLSALALCLYQNRYYILQRFSGPGSRWGITAFLIAFSFYFALILPGGFGLYWTAGNLLGILVVWVCNLIDDPKPVMRQVEAALLPQPTRAEKAARRKLDRGYKKQERADMAAFAAYPNKGLMIYSEGSGYWKYFARMVTWLLDTTDIVIHYVTNDPNDQVFARTSERLRAYYVGPHAFISFMMRLDVDVCLMTTPDLEKYHVKRSIVRPDVEYVYLDHGMGSFSMMLREGALDHFDTVYCYGPNHIADVRQTEAVYHLPAKRLVKTGFGLLDDLRDAVATLDLSAPHDPPVALVAPSWQPQNILELCLDDLVGPLLDAGFHVTVRPHPEFVKRFGAKLAGVAERYAQWGDRFELQTDFSSNSTVYEADVVITDWSTIAQEFSFATLKPSIFVNTPMKIMNPNYERIEAVPLEISIRDKIGRSVDVADLAGVGEVARAMVAERAGWRDRIAGVVDANIFHVGSAGPSMGRYVLDSLARHQRARDLVVAHDAQRAGTLTPEQQVLLDDERVDARRAQIADVVAQADKLEALAARLRARADAARRELEDTV